MKIENKARRQVTYSKRRHGLLKKVYELSVLCAIDTSFVSFSSTGQLSAFTSQNNKIEDLWSRFVNDPEVCLENRQKLIELVRKLQRDRDVASHLPPELQEMQQEIYHRENYFWDTKQKLSAYEQTSDSSVVRLTEMLQTIIKTKQMLKAAAAAAAAGVGTTSQFKKDNNKRTTGGNNNNKTNFFRRRWYPTMC